MGTSVSAQKRAFFSLPPLQDPAQKPRGVCIFMVGEEAVLRVILWLRLSASHSFRAELMPSPNCFISLCTRQKT